MDKWRPIEKCDVSDKEALAIYRYYWRRWDEILNGDDIHAIWKQISALLAIDAEFRVINETRKINTKKRRAQNYTIHILIDKGFVAHQALTIRRITEPFEGPKRKAVYSLPRLIDEIAENQNLITRENYVCLDGSKYTEKDPPKKYLVDAKHKIFDKLSGRNHKNRSRNDIIDQKYFTHLRSKLKSSEGVRTYANKFLAHAADPNTRKSITEISLNKLDTVYRDLIYIAKGLSGIIRYHFGYRFFPSYTFNPWKALDIPIIDSSDIDKVYNYWELRKKEIKEIEKNNS